MKASFIIPVYNEEKIICNLLESIFSQKFDGKEFEVLIIDGGSNDNTIKVAQKYPVKIIDNPAKSEEPGRILGMEQAKGDILIFVDADNILVGNDWLTKALEPFEDKEIAFADTIKYSYRKKDKIGVKYQALIGGDDPIVMYLGLYSRWCYLKENWTGCPHKDIDKGNYFKCIFLDEEKIPPMGSNGFLVRKNLLKKVVDEHFIHSDIVYDLIKMGGKYFAKVKIGLIHNQPEFFKKKVRRAQRRFEREFETKYDYGISKKELIFTSAWILLVFPLIFDSFRGFLKKPDASWFFHPVATLGGFFIYGWYALKNNFNTNLELR